MRASDCRRLALLGALVTTGDVVIGICARKAGHKGKHRGTVHHRRFGSRGIAEWSDGSRGIAEWSDEGASRGAPN